MELECYSWTTCSKQSQLLLHRCRQQARPSTMTTSFADNAIDLLFPKSKEIWDKVPEGSNLIFGDTQISLQQCGIGGRKPPCQNPARFIQSFQHSTGLWRKHGDSKYHAVIALRGKTVLDWISNLNWPCFHARECWTLLMLLCHASLQLIMSQWISTLADLGFFRGGWLWEPEQAKRASIEGIWAYGRMKFQRLWVRT